jgi:hypothetical protein
MDSEAGEIVFSHAEKVAILHNFFKKLIGTLIFT